MKIFKILLLTFFVFLFSFQALSQTKVLDSLFVELKKQKEDSIKIDVLNAIAEQYENDPAKMMDYSRKALKLAQEKRLKRRTAYSWFNVGTANILQSNYAEALKNFTNTQVLYEELVKSPGKEKVLPVKQALAATYGSIGIVCSEQNNYAKALEYYFRALKLYKEIKKEDVVVAVYNNIGNIYEIQKEYSKALEYFNKALWIQKKTGDYSSAITITNIGKIYLAKEEDAKALASFKEAEKIFQRHANLRGMGELYNNLGNYYKKKNATANAESYYKRALGIFEQTGEEYGASAALGYLGGLYAYEGKNLEAIHYLQKSSALAGQIGVPEQVKESEKILSEVYEKIGKSDEALKHYKKYSAAKESINDSENIKSMVREEMNYEFERKEALQKIENEKRQVMFEEQAKRHKLEIFFTALFILLLFGIIFLIYSRLQLKKTLTLQRDLAEYEQKALHLQMNPHFVFNCLGSISSFIVQNGKESAIKYLAKFSKLMRLTLEYSKESLIPIDKEIEGLQNYLELEQLRFNKIFDFTITKDPAIEDDMALPPLLLQPFVENAIIHGIVPKKGGNITVDFAIKKEKLVCTVIDDGVGINKSKELKENSVTVHKSLALEITRKRLEVIQAVTSKDSSVEINELTDSNGNPLGTKIILNLPIQYASDKL